METVCSLSWSQFCRSSVLLVLRWLVFFCNKSISTVVGWLLSHYITAISAEKEKNLVSTQIEAVKGHRCWDTVQVIAFEFLFFKPLMKKIWNSTATNDESYFLAQLLKWSIDIWFLRYKNVGEVENACKFTTHTRALWNELLENVGMIHWKYAVLLNND